MRFFPPSQLPGCEPGAPATPIALEPRWRSPALRIALLGAGVLLGCLTAWLGLTRTGSGWWLLGLPACLVASGLLAYRLTRLPGPGGKNGGPILW